MDTIHEPERDIPVVHEADVVVIGGGCTGVFAAVRAARLGMRVAIVEKQNCFGGVATAGIVNVWHSLYDTTGTQQIIGGLTVEALDRLRKRDAVRESPDRLAAFWLNTEELKIDLDELITESQIQPFLHTFYAAPILSDGRLDAVVIENKNGRQAIRARQFVDATGDGDVARSIGVPLRAAGPLQPPTTCAKILGMNSLDGFDWQAALRQHGPEFGLGQDWGWGGAIPGLPDVQMRADTHVFDTDVADAGQLTHAEIDGRRRVRAIMDLIRTYGPPESHIALADLAATLGGRESQRMVARRQLTDDDLLAGRCYTDGIANGTYPVDIHHSDEPGITFRHLDGREFVIRQSGLAPEAGRWRDPLPGGDPTFYQIPFGCLVQETVPNLALSGRMLDADKIAFSAVRVMVNMNQTGEAAGVACALAVDGGGDVCDVEPERLRNTLAAGGSIVL